VRDFVGLRQPATTAAWATRIGQVGIRTLSRQTRIIPNSASVISRRVDVVALFVLTDEVAELGRTVGD
jgi:hypothetical protein